MESNGVPGQIHLSSDMYHTVGTMTSIFDFTCCGENNIKGKGAMTTYLAVTRDKEEDELPEKKELNSPGGRGRIQRNYSIGASSATR
jgi:hypothetical protein